MTLRLWVDDLRPAPEGWTLAVSSDEALEFLSMTRALGEVIDVMSLDHDLGGDDTSRRIVLWMCEREWWPREVRVHSANPVGIEWLEGMIERYHVHPDA